MRISTFALVLAVACDRGEHREAREKYNEGVALLEKADFDGAEKAFLDARSGAGVDPELRFRAAYDLGFAYDAHAQKTKLGKDADLAKALELEEQAVTWLSDAQRLRKDDGDTVANLAIVRARAQALSDELARGEGKLEVRLDKVLKEQRGVLEDARGAWLAIKTSGGADPLAQQATLTRLADQERGIVAEVGVINDLAADEIDPIGKKPEDKRTPEERVRVVQLENLDIYLNDGRTKISEARRKLQDLAAEDGVSRAEAALIALKRAREQLLDPIAVLREVARDELDLVQETHAVAEATGVGHKLLGSAAAPEAPRPIPAWLEPPALGERQGGLHDRVEEVRTRLAATVDSVDRPVGQGSAAEPPKLTPEQAKVIDQIRLALPLVIEASADMERASAALSDRKIDDATTAERDALIALAKAIEHFSDLKQTIELAYGTQQQLVGLLSPEGAKVPVAERTTATRDGLAQNLARMGRIKDLLGDEVTKLDQQRQQLDAKGAGSGSGAPDPKQLEAANHQLEQAKQQMAAAEVLRAEATTALGALDGAIKANQDPLTPAKLAASKLEQLRRLFFSVIEHLQELVRTQGETRDQTSQASGEDDFTRAPKLPGLIGHQDEHGQMAKAITDALAKQADEGAKAQGQQQEQAKAAAAAAAEVRLAQNDMSDAKTALAKAQDTKTQSFSLKPAADSQGKAIEHLENALRLLQPPKDDKNKDQKQEQQQQQQQQQQQPKPDDKQQQQHGGAGQRARDEDAKRQRDKQKPPGNDAVDQDW